MPSQPKSDSSRTSSQKLGENIDDRMISMFSRNGCDQTFSVGMLGICVDLVGAAGFNDFALVHHDQLVGHVLDDGEIVRNEQITHPVLVLEVLQEVEKLRLD